MKIAQVAPLAERCPPRLYGGTERIVSYLTEELVRQGHDVTLFASGDSRTAARLVRCSDMALRLNPAVKDHMPYHLVMLDEVRRRADDFDVIHFHIDLLQFPLIRDFADRTRHHAARPARPARPEAVLCGVPGHSAGLDLRQPAPAHAGGELGRHGPARPAARSAAVLAAGRKATISPSSDASRPRSGPTAPSRSPRRAGLPLRIAAKVDKVDRAYWDMVIAPLVARHDNWSSSSARSARREKASFLGNARALLFPIDWPEPFGLVMIEAMACGTPVIACSCGSVPEVVDDGVTGFIVGDDAEAVAAVRRAAMLDRAGVRAVFERRFTVERMAMDYLSIYRGLPGVRRDAARLRRAEATVDRCRRWLRHGARSGKNAWV